MFKTNKISFSIDPNFLKYNKDIVPIKASDNLPDWFKNLKTDPLYRTVKSCVPFLDSLTAGYILKTPVDIQILFNEVDKEKNKRYMAVNPASKRCPFAQINNVEDGGNAWHTFKQIEGSKLIEKNKGLPIFKIKNPWIIKTPPGYSCLFLNLLNNYDDRFEIVSGIVDTDRYDFNIHFPIIINGDKYETLNTVIERGTPFAQVIPFKRESWKMEIKEEKNNEALESSYFTKLWKNYRIKSWIKKSWK